MTTAAPGRPRDESLDHAILTATRELLKELDYGAVSMSGIARTASVGKTTVYRRWPSKGLVVWQALFAEAFDVDELPASGELAADLRAWLSRIAEVLDSAAARNAVPGLLGDFASDDALRRTVREEFIFPARERLVAMFEQAAARGEVDDRLPAPSVTAALVGGLVFRSVLSGLPLDEGFVDELVDLALHGIGAGRDATSRSNA